MKRILFLICALILLADLADDGCLGKTKVPQCPGKIPSTSSPHDWGEVDTQVDLPPAKLLGISQLFQFLVTLFEAARGFDGIDFYLLSSSGGIPL
jgi:hypothetical protein